VPFEALERERERREAAETALAETRINLARVEGQVMALNATLADARAALDVERREREAPAAELRERSRPLWQRVLGELRRRRQQG